jgi:starch synthase (maltosyl-transferring)
MTAPSIAREAQAALPESSAPPSSILIQDISPQVDCGRYPVKREAGDVLTVSADIFKDGTDKIAARLELTRQGTDKIDSIDMVLVDNDRWTAQIPLVEPGRYRYRIVAFPDHLATKRDEIIKKFDAGIDISLELREFDAILDQVTTEHPDARSIVADIRSEVASRETDGARVAVVTGIETIDQLRPFREIGGTTATADYPLMVDRVQARFASWYEMFPRSAGTVPGQSATFRDVEALLPRISGMGFDVLYFTPIHPIGSTNRKGKNNTLNATPDDPGVPYAIGSAAGGHDAIEPNLGSIDDFDHLVEAAAGYGIEICLDLAIQASPDHPWATSHPDWFTIRPDGSIKFAENPPKKYEDIYPVNFDTQDWQALWLELLRIVQFWVDHGVRTFRVDNPHTKPIPFWEWLIERVHETDPGVIFLSEAFTRPKVMKGLAKAGFAQSYTYFTWRVERWELEEYFHELTNTSVADYMRGNLFPNTHDINPYHLQTGGRPAFKSRFVLASTLSSVYGIYSGFELCEATPVPGKEEYLNSEKYEYKVWDWDREGNIIPLITRVNEIRKQYRPLQEYDNLRFHGADDQRVMVYSKTLHDDPVAIVCIVSLDPHSIVDTWIHLDLSVLNLNDNVPYQVEELITGNTWNWTGAHHPIQIDPEIEPVWILAVSAMP